MMMVQSCSSLNPYSNGRYSMRQINIIEAYKIVSVLILILMEDTL